MSSNSCVDVSAVIPVYNAGPTLKLLHSRLTASLEAIGLNAEIVYVNDGSKDDSWTTLEKLAGQDSRVVAIDLSRNFGQHKALTAGLDHATGQNILFMDCDLQDKPEDIERLFEKMNEGFDIVIARWNNRNDALHKKLSSMLFYRVLSAISGVSFQASERSFRVLNSKAAGALRSLREENRVFGMLCHWIGFRVGYIEVARDRRHSGSSSYSYVKLFDLAFSFLTSATTRPLKLAIISGFLCAGASLVIGLYFLVRNLIYASQVPGWASIIVSVFFTGGLILFNLGILSWYVANLFGQLNSRPIYIVSQVVSSSPRNEVLVT